METAGFGGPLSFSLCPQASGSVPFYTCPKLVDLTKRMGERTMGRGLLRET